MEVIEKKSYDILGKVSVDINITENRFDIPIDRLLHMAARVNPKRSFLFVSKVLGKHIPIKPKDGLLIGGLLGAMLYEGKYDKDNAMSREIVKAFKKDAINGEEVFSKVFRRAQLEDEMIFIGFAETATALGHSAFSFFEDNCYYMHTTREELEGYSKCITFEEEHSHATSHRVYSLDEDIMSTEAPIVLIDDEITTGKTLLNIIEDIQSKYPRKEYNILTILDWRNEESINAFRELEYRLGIRVTVHSVVKGYIDVDDDEIKKNPLVNTFTTRDKVYDTEVSELDVSSLFIMEILDDIGYLNCTGRVGMDSDANEELIDLIGITANHINSIVDSEKILCLGTEEFMFIPMAISTLIDGDVRYQSTTRSPIYPWDKEGYGATTADKISSTYNNDVDNYMYNVHEQQYDQAIVFVERDVDLKDSLMIEAMKKQGYKKILIVNFVK